MPIPARDLFDALHEAGVRQFSGVPCSILDPLQRCAEAAGWHLACHVEGEAVAASVGSWLAGGLGAALLQSSGLGNAVNPLISLAIPYRVPLLLVVSWRGEPGRPDAVHHLPMGEATLPLLELLGVSARVLREDTPLAAVRDELRAAVAGRRPLALVVPRGALRGDGSPRGEPSPAPPPAPPGIASFGGGPLPSRAEAVAAFVAACGDLPTVSTTGYTSRELAQHGSLERRFPMQGSMGFALGVALGAARVAPDRAIAVLDGDGALLMRLGSLATAALLGPRNLLHVVLDNRTYGSTGRQPTASPLVDFAAAAVACGWPGAGRCAGRGGLAEALAWARSRLGSGPVLLHVRISPAEAAARERPEQRPDAIASGFRAFLVGGAEP